MLRRIVTTYQNRWNKGILYIPYTYHICIILSSKPCVNQTSWGVGTVSLVPMFEAKVLTSSWWTAPDLMKLSWVASAGGCDGLVGSWGVTSLNGVVKRKGGPNLRNFMYGVTWNFPNFSRNLEWTLCWRTSRKEFSRNFRRRQTLHVCGASPEG